MLVRVDWLAVTAPLNSETTPFFNRDRLALLPAGAHINIAHGRIIEEATMADAARLGASTSTCSR